MSKYWEQSDNLKLADKRLENIIAELRHTTVDIETINSLEILKRNLRTIQLLLENTDIAINQTVNLFHKLQE